MVRTWLESARVWASLAFACVALVVGTASRPALAQNGPDKGWESAYTQQIEAGPYDITIHYTRWPVRARTNQRFIVEVEGGIEGKSARWKWIPALGESTSDSRFRKLQTYPGIEGAWVLEIAGMIDRGLWRWVIEIDGPAGKFVGESEPYVVGPPPGFPIWLGWLIGLFPLYGLIWFGVREARRTKRMIAQSGPDLA